VARDGRGPPGGHGLHLDPPVDQGIEHSAGASFAPNPQYFDPENIVKLALEGGCNAVASTVGVLGAVSRRYAHKLPFIVKLNHNEFLSYPNAYDQIRFSSVRRAWDLGAAGVGATIYFGSEESKRQIVEIAERFEEAHQLGMFTVLWCYVRNSAFKVDGVNYELSADLSGQANHLGVTIQADIIKQKLPENNGGYTRSTATAGSTARRTSSSTTSSRRTTRSTSRATSWPTATWAASRSSTRAARRPARPTSPRP
jgi:class I fructose-bisphosphate aldolase